MARPTTFDPEQLRAVLLAGISPATAASSLHVSLRTVQRWVETHLPELLGAGILSSPVAPTVGRFIFTRVRRMHVSPVAPEENHG